jgi:hypothetical protein
MTGSEEYRMEKTAAGFRLSGKAQIEGPGLKGTNTYELDLAPDRSFRGYKLEAQVGSGTQVIEARREGDKVVMRAAAGGQGRDRTVDFKPGTFLLDNLITGPIQVLLDEMPAGPLNVLVPQVLMAVSGSLKPVGQVSGTFNGKPVTARKFELTLGSSVMEILALPPSNLLLRASVSLQGVDLVREGFVPAPEKAQEAPAGVQERPATFSSGDLQFPGTVCLPAKRSARVPLVVLVHGSGSHDADETIGPNKPFRDLAWDLAEAGIATLRYPKRTFAFKEKLDVAHLTVEEEVIADAVAAVKYAQTLPEADPQRVFLLGHSLGATLAPFIAGRTPPLRGVVLMAGTLRPLDELIYEQTAFQLGVAGQNQEEIARQVGRIKQTFARIRSGEAKDDEKVMNAPVFYWRDLLGRDPRAAWQKLKLPVLVLQGGKDVQVVKTDYDGLREAVTCEPHWFPNLNHLFMPVEGQPTGGEYSKASHVDPEVIKVIAAWVGKN